MNNEANDTEKLPPLKRIKKAYMDSMSLSEDDSYVVDAMVAGLTATYHPDCTEPVWLWIIGPPGSGKTETVRAIEKYEGCIFVSSLTENALLSGYADEDGTDPSLVPMLDGKVLVIKDATALMSDPKRMHKLAGDLRDCFDGSCAKPSGKAGLRSYDSSFGIIACITDEIDNFMEQYQQLGERFLSIRIHRSSLYLKERVEYLFKVRSTMKDKLKWQQKLKELSTTEIDNIRDKALTTDLPDSSDVDEDILMIADSVSLLRSTMVNGNASTPELSTRISQQILNITLSRAFALDKDKLDEKDVNFARRIAIDSLPSARLRTIRLLYKVHEDLRKRKTGLTIGGMQSKLTGITTATIASMMTQYHHIGLVIRFSGVNNKYLYRISDNAYDYLKESEILEDGKHQRPVWRPEEIVQEEEKTAQEEYMFSQTRPQ